MPPSPAEEIKSLADSIKSEFTQFREANEARLKEIEKKGHAASELEQKTLKISESMTAMEEKIEAIKTTLARVPAPGATDPVEAKKQIQLLSSKQIAHFLRRGKSHSEESAKAYIQEMAEHFGGGDMAKGMEHPEIKALSVGSDPDGGYFVRPAVSAEITKKVFESSPMRQLADIITISTDAFEELYDYDEPSSAAVGENDTRSETNSNEINKIRIECHELTAMPKASQKLLDDSAIDVESWHAGKVVEKFERDEATWFVTGNGVNKARGITAYTAGDGFNMVEQVASGVSASTTADKLIEFQDSLFEPFQGNATWLMRRAVWTLIRQLKDGEGRYLVAPGGNLLSGNTYELLGRPVRMGADMPAAGANSLSIAYGDFKRAYLIVDRIGIRVLRDPYTTKGQVLFYTTKRTGGGIRNFQALKLMKFGS